jgi:hypothetical protein
MFHFNLELPETSSAVELELRKTLDAADQYLQSWAGWGYEAILKRDAEMGRHYARTYASSVSGQLLSMGFNEDTGDFYATWKVNKSISAPTEIRINKIYYSDGFYVMVTPSNGADWNVISINGNSSLVKVSYTKEIQDGREISVRIRRKVVLPRWWQR